MLAPPTICIHTHIYIICVHPKYAFFSGDFTFSKAPCFTIIFLKFLGCISLASKDVLSSAGGPGILNSPQKSNELDIQKLPFLKGPVTFSKAHHFGALNSFSFSGVLVDYIQNPLLNSKGHGVTRKYLRLAPTVSFRECRLSASPRLLSSRFPQKTQQIPHKRQHI